MKNKRQSKEKRKSSRVLAVLMALMMITALILPIGAKASETSDGSASGASQAVAEEYTKKEEEKDSSHCDAEKEEEKEKTDSAENQEKEQKSDSSADASLEDSADSKTESKDSEAKDSGSKDTESKVESSDSDQTSGKNASNKDASNKETSNVEGGKGAEKDSIADQKDSGNTDASKDEEDKTDAASPTKDASSGKSGQAETSEETAEQVTAEQKDDDSTITFRTEEVTVIADKKAFDTEVTMKVKKVTDPEQLLKMVIALQEEGGSYTVKAYNVSFYDKKGKEVEPKIPVQVNVNTKVSAPKKTKVVHVKDDDKTEILDADIDRSGASFELGSFSDIGVATEGKAKIPGSSFDIYLGDELTTEYTVNDLPAGPISEKDLPAVDGYTYENATVGDDQVEELGTITDEDGNVYVYYTTKDENGTIKAEILGDGRIRINLVETEKDTTYDLDADGAHVHVEAPADAFDEGTYMEISGVELTDEQQAQVREQAEEVLGENTAMKIQAVDITFYDKDGGKVQPGKPVKVVFTTPEKVKGNFCVVHLGDSASLIDAQRSEAGAVSFSADSFSVYAVVDTGNPKEVPRLTYNFLVDDTLYNTQIVKNGDILYDPGFPGFPSNPDESEFLGWFYSDNGTEVGPITFGDTVSGVTEDRTIEAYAKIRTTYYVTFKSAGKAVVQVKKFEVETGVTPKVDASGVTYTPTSEYVCVGWSTIADEETRNASNPQITETQSVDVTGNMTFYPVCKRANWIHFNENDGGSGGGASYTGPVYVEVEQSLSNKKPADPTRAGYDFGGWYYDAACNEQFLWTDRLLEDDTHLDQVNHDVTLYAKWTPKGDTPYNIAYWKQNTNDDEYTLVEVKVVENNNAGETTNVASRPDLANKYSSDHYNLSTTKLIEEQVISNKGNTTVNVYYDLQTYDLRFYFARQYSYDDRTYLQVNNNDEGFHSTARTSLRQALTYRSGNDYIRQSGTNTWKTINAGSAAELIDSSFLSSIGSSIQQETYSSVTTDVFTNTTGSHSVQTPDITYYYFPVTVKYGQSLVDIWPTSDHFNGQTMSNYNPTNDSAGGSAAYDPRGKAIYPLSWGRYKKGDQINGLYALADSGIVNDGNNGYYLLYWRFQTAHTVRYEVYFSALSNETGNYVEQTDKELFVYTGEPYNSNSNPQGYVQVSNITFEGVDFKSRTDYNQSGTYSGTAYEGRIRVYYDRHRNNVIFHTNVDQGDTVNTGGSAAAFTTKQTVPSVQFGEKIAAYNGIQTVASAYVVDSTTRRAADGTIYLFKGWYNNEAFYGDPVAFNDPDWTMPDGALNFYAKWEKQRAQITLEPNGGTLLNGQVASFKLDFGDTISQSSLERNIERPGYTLIGWYEVVDGTVSPSPYPYDPVHNDVTLRARWRKDGNISIEYVSNGMVVDGTTISGTTPPTDEMGYSSDSSVVVAAAPTSIPQGFQFIGWELGGTTYYPNNSFDITDDLIGANNTITLTAVYQKIGGDDSSTATTSITFNANGGTGADYVVDKSESDPAKDLRVNEEITAPTVTQARFSRTGYKFLGWHPDKNAKTPMYEAGRKIAADNKTGSGWDDTLKKNILYAIWQKTYTVTILKVVAPETTTDTTSFSFADPGFNPEIEGDVYSGSFNLGNGESKVYPDVPAGTKFKVKETANDAYEVSVKYKIENAVDTDKNGTFSLTEYDPEHEYTADGDITVTVTNTRKNVKLKIDKVVKNGTPVDLSKSFTFTWKAEKGNTTERQGTVTLSDSAVPSEIEVPVGTKLTVTESTDQDWHYETASVLDNVTGNTEIVVPAVSADMDGKTITFTNTRKAGGVNVTKIVSGNMGETDKAFSFTASIKDGGTSLKLAETNGVIKIDTENGSESITFDLSHENIKQFQDLPEGAVLTITESEYGEYQQTCKIGDGSEQESRSAEVTVSGDQTNVVFTNTKTAVAPTQLYSGTGPMAVLVVFSLGALILLAAHHFIDRFRNSNSF